MFHLVRRGCNVQIHFIYFSFHNSLHDISFETNHSVPVLVSEVVSQPPTELVRLDSHLHIHKDNKTSHFK